MLGLNLFKINCNKPLPADTLAALEGEFTASELSVALKAMANGKALGPDGFTVAYYRAFFNLLIPRLTNYANSVPDGGSLRPETLHAHITVLPKPVEATALFPY